MGEGTVEMKLDMSLDEISQQQQQQPPRGGRGRGGFRGGRGRGGGRQPREGGSSQPSNRVYVGNLAWQISWQDLKDHMRQAGNVVYADVLTEETGRSKGCGIVEYSTPEEAANAIQTLNDSVLKERLIFVREDREDKGSRFRRGGGGSYGTGFAGRQLFVGNLPYNCSWQDLKDHFRQFGNVIRADVLMEPTGRSKGQGIVIFETAEEAQRAIKELHDTDFQGRQMIVHEDKFAQ